MDTKGLAAAVTNHLGFLDAYGFLRRKLTRSQVAILMYHRVAPKENNWSLEPISPEGFERQMEYFSRSYEILSLDELAEYIKQGKPLPEQAVVITLDDGYKDNYLYAYPILKKYHVPATIFLTTGHIGTGELFWFDRIRYAIHHTPMKQLDLGEFDSYYLRSEPDRSRAGFIIVERLKKLSDEEKDLLIQKFFSILNVDIPADLGKKLILSWDEVEEMSNDGIAFGAHSVNHPVLVNLPLEQAKWEIIQSKRGVEEKIRKAVTAFSYPNGAFNAQITKLAKESGFTCAVSTLHSKLISSKDSLYKLSRVGVAEDFNKLKVGLSGLWGDLRTTLSRENK